MKKTLLTLTLIFMLLAIPVAADTPYRLIVDDVLVDKPVVIINDLSYVPVRTIADIFNAVTEWDGETKTISIKQEIKRPQIIGNKEFTEKISEALNLLEEKDFPHYVMVCENTMVVRQAPKPHDASEKSIASANKSFETLIYPELIANPDWYTPLFLTGMLVHENCHHIDWKHDGTTNKEKEARAHQRAVYDLLNAPQWMIDTWR